MKKLIIMMAFSAIICGCGKNDPQWPFGPDGPFGPGGPDGTDGPGMQGGMGQAGSFDETALGEVATFQVAPYTSAHVEPETIPAGDEDYIENKSFKGEIRVEYRSDGEASVTGAPEGAVSIEGNRVTANVTDSYMFILSGKASDARFKLYSEKANAIVLNGVEISNPTGAAINIQSKKRTFLVLADGTSNALTDGSKYVTENDEKQKGTYYSKGQTIISGKGALSISANYKHGIDTKGYLRIRPGVYITINSVAGNCIKCEESTEDGIGLTIEGGTLNLRATATAGKCMSTDGNMTINGGYVCAITSGDGEWDGDDADPKDVSGAAGVKCDGIFTMNDGELLLSSSGNGGKGINGDTKIVINGGKVRALTTGSVYSYTYGGFIYDTSPKGIKCDKEIEVSGGDIMVRALGAQEGSEGIEAKEKFSISGGKVQIYAADDALNSGYSSESIAEKQKMGIDISGMKADAGQIIISGGELYAYSTSNDAIDANGTISVTGGLAVAVGAGEAEGGFDCDNNTFSIKGGTLIGIGGSHSTPTESACSQPVVIIGSQNFTSGDDMVLKGEEQILSYKVVRTFSGANLLITSPSFSKGGSYTFGSSTISCASDRWVNGSAAGGFGGPGGNPGPGGGLGPGRPN